MAIVVGGGEALGQEDRRGTASLRAAKAVDTRTSWTAARSSRALDSDAIVAALDAARAGS